MDSSEMNNVEKFDRMVSLLNLDERLRQQLLADPEGFLATMGLDKSILNDAPDQSALARANEVLTAAQLTSDDDAISSLKKLRDASQGIFGDVALDINPIGFVLMERPTNPASFSPTASGTTKCTLNPYDGCSADVDF